MKKILRFRKELGSALLLLILLALIPLFNSCNTQKEEAAPGCVTLTKAQIKLAWADPGYLTPGNADLIDSVKFYTSYIPGVEFIVTGMGSKSNGVSVESSGVELSPGTDCLANLPSNVVYGPNQIKLSTLGITDPGTGALTQFNYLRLEPERAPDPYTQFIRYRVYKIDRGGEHYMGTTDPCPPLCPDSPIILPPPTDSTTATVPVDSTLKK